MSYDTLIMKAVTDELRAELATAPVQRVYEPERNVIILHLYTPGQQTGLLISTDSQYARVHLTEKRFHGREQPSPFCMLLRKYLIGARPLSFKNPPFERVLEIDFAPPEGMPPVRLIAEIMSRRSNLILTNDRGIILGAAKIASWDKNPKRAVMPGEEYQPAPTQGKLNPLTMELEVFFAAMQKLISDGKTAEQALIGSVAGVSPLIARELLCRSGQGECEFDYSINKLYEQIRRLFQDSADGSLKPLLLPARNICAAIKLTHLPEEKQVEYESVNKMLDHFYDQMINAGREKVLKKQLTNTAEKRLAALQKKRLEQESELRTAEKANQYRLYGELLLTYGDQVPRGAESVIFPDLYDPEKVVAVPLNPSLTAGANAQKHFSRYRKAKNGQDKIKKQLLKTRAEIKYCEELLYSIDAAFNSSLEEIRLEMIEAGYLKDKQKSVRKKALLPQPLTFRTSSGRTILVGRNNRQNDYVTFNAAVRRDTWFHVRQLPGSHVVLKEASYPPPPEDVEEASFLAAFFSRGRESGAVAVDYTEVRHVRRRPGGKPGFVFYENYETITVNPQDQRLREQFGLQDKD